jgi:hypothetical protein
MNNQKLSTFNEQLKEEEVKKEENPSFHLLEHEYFNKVLDEMGFSRYHFLLFIIAASVLICGGMQELMQAILLSLINDEQKLTEYHLAVINSTEYLGYVTGSIIVNLITQYLSNKRSIQLFSILCLVFSGLSIIRIDYYLAVVTRFFIGLCLGIIDLLIYLSLLETCPTKIRGFVSSVILVFFPLGQFLISFFIYFNITEGDLERNYRYLLLIPFLSIAGIIIMLIFVQESPRRFINMNKIEEGISIIGKITKFNKKESVEEGKNKMTKELDFIRQNTIKVEEKEEGIQRKGSESRSHLDFPKKQLSFFQMLKIIISGDYLSYTLTLWTIAIGTGLIFNGIFFMLPTTAPKLDRTSFKDVLLSVTMELPSHCFASLLIENKWLGRVKSIRLGFLISFTICCICLLIGYDYLIINCLLKVFITIPNNILLVYSSEIYDSEIRTFGVSAINFWKRLSFIASPFIVSYFEYQIGPIGPYYIFTPFTLICWLLTFMFKFETRGVPLDETLKKT